MNSEKELLLRYLRQYQTEPGSRIFAPLADLYRKMKKYDEALTICHEGLAHHPRYPGGHVALGNVYVDLERYEEALAEYELALSQTPDNLPAMRGAASCYQALGQLDRAVRYYRMYQFLVPKDAVAKERLAALEAHLKQTQPPPIPRREKGPVQLDLVGEADLPSTYDHYRLSSLGGRRPAQRGSLVSPPPAPGKKIQLLYRLLRGVQSRISRPRLDVS